MVPQFLFSPVQLQPKLVISRLADTNTTPQNARFQQNRSQYRAPPLQGNFNRLQPHNSFAQNQNQNTPRTQNNPHQNYENLYEKIRQLENQVHTLNTRITQLENNPVQYEKKFSNIETQVTNITTNINTINAQQVKYDEILQKLTDNISKLSEAVYVRDKPAKTPKRIAPYDKTSYEQTKKKHFTRSSSKPSSSKNSADDSDNFPQTEDDAIMQQHLENFTDNAVDDGIIEPDSDYTQNENAPISSPYGYGIFNFASRK
ncbi:unnamed protein product [Rhizophagus irregularis]|nr:unnamed protein product [Rhizophagus irregularis]